MRAARLTGIGSCDVIDVPSPTPGPGEVLVRCDAVGICRSDLHYFEHGRIGASEAPFPFILGHESAGTVVELGDGVTAPAVGTRVAIEPGIGCGHCEWCLRGDPNLCANIRFHGSPPTEGAMREYFAHPAELCIPLDASLSIDDGVMLEPLAIGVHTCNLVNVQPGDTVAVLGVGPVGMMCLTVAAARGAERIIAVDLHDYRLAIAERYGATETLNATSADTVAAISELTGGRGVDVVFEATSSPDVPGQAALIAALGGRVALIGICDDPTVAFPTHEARRKGLTLRWVRRSKLAVQPAMGLVTSGRIALTGLVTHHIPLANIQDGFELVAGYGDNVFKAVVQPHVQA